jgi:hypothetical protein
MKPPFPTQEDLICAYLSYESGGEGTGWVVSSLWDLCHDHPSAAFDTILKIIERDSSIRTLISIGAGPLESLLSLHGERMVESVSDAASKSGSLRISLAAVWRCGMPDHVWDHIQRIADHQGLEKRSVGPEKGVKP